MDIVELLKQVGLTQYEAEAYYTLLREGPLTGYELGKRSKVPLPRSYDVVERLVERGLALVQPAALPPHGGSDPPRYLAEDPTRFLDRLHAGMTARLEELTARLTTVSPPEPGEEFWVIRGRDRVGDRVAAMIRGTEHTIGLRLPPTLEDELSGLAPAARARGCRLLPLDEKVAAMDGLLVLVDDREALVGTVDAEPCQAVVTRNRALVAMARDWFASETPGWYPRRRTIGSEEPVEAPTDWLVWEGDKHRRLRLLIGGSDVA